MNEVIALWPYIVVNMVLAMVAIRLYVSYRKKRKEMRMEEMRAIELKKQEEKILMLRYRAIFNTPLVDIIYYDANGALEDLNEKACKSFGKTREEMLNGHYTIDEYLNGKDLETFDYFHAVEMPDTPDGAYYEVQVLPIRNKKGKLIGFFRTALDITGSVNFNRQLRQSTQKLIEANESLVNHTDNINYALNVGGIRLVTYSPENHTMSIFEDSTTVKFTLTREQCFNLLDDASAIATKRMLDSMDKWEDGSFEVHVRTKLKLKYGIPLHLFIKFQPTYDDQGNIEEYFGLLRDESKIISKEKQLAKESKRALEAEGVKGAFLSNMSHEIRTPLTSVIGFAELLDQSGTKEEQDMFIDQIKSSSAYLLRLVNDILYLSRLDANMIEPKKQTIDIASCFAAFCENGWEKYKKEGVNYVVKNDYHSLVTILPDENLHKIIELLTSNAAKNTDSGSVTASCDYYDNRLTIIVSDTGHGISEEAQVNIFDRFLTDKNGGTGLGLVICKRLVNQMKGAIKLTSRPEYGTTVWVTIPCKVTKIERKKNL